MSKSAEEEPLGVALIGAGMVSGVHMAAIAEATKSVQLRGVFSRHPERARAALESSGLSGKVYDSVDEVAADDAVDFAIVITPPDTRVDMAKRLAGAGKPILMEKPVARNLGEAKDVIAICERAGVPLGIVLQHRFRAASLEAKRLVAGGTLGRLALAELSVPWWRDQAYYDEPGRGTYARDGGGVLISQAIHTIDLALSLIGPVASVQAMTATTRLHRTEVEDFAVAGMQLASGAVGSLVASTASYPGGAESIVMHFEKASLKLEGGQLDLSWQDGRTETLGQAAGTGGGRDPMAFSHDWHLAVLEDFADALRHGRPPAVTGRDALHAHALIAAIEKSSRSGTRVEVEQ